MPLKPWFHIVSPREDLREGRPLDASEFAVHLDQVRDHRAPEVYQNPEQFFRHTYLTKNLIEMSSGVVRRLSGEKTETSAIYNMSTQFGGGKTHALAMLYHLAQHGVNAERWPGVEVILDKAGIKSMPRAATAVFVGTEFDSIMGRGGDDGTPLRKTPWGELAYQLGGDESFAVVAEHDNRMEAPGGDVIRKFLPSGPCLILMDELMNYISRTRKNGMASQFYNFLQSFSEEARGRDNLVLIVSIPASELEMTPEDQSDFERFKKLLDRLGKAVFISSDSETSEIIRRRLFEWDERAVTRDGRVMLPREAIAACQEYAGWVRDNHQQLPTWFPLDNPQEAFMASYPFHPMVLSVFERKWQALPRFQRTRGILRLLALWVSNAYVNDHARAYHEPLISLGSAPLDDPMFRAAMFEQLGSDERLEAVVTTDICGKADSHSTRLDTEATAQIKKIRLHRKIATAIFFESNGGALRAEATMPEIRLAVGEPLLDIGNVETVLEVLTESCYYLNIDRNRYRFGLSPNLNKILADRRANIKSDRVDACIREEVQKVFSPVPGIERVFFPEKSSQISDRALLTIVIPSPEQVMPTDGTIPQMVDTMTREYGNSSRTFKSALIWCIPDSNSMAREEAKKHLAWEDIYDNDAGQLNETQLRQLSENRKKAQRDLTESIWRTYKNIVLLNKHNAMRHIDMGLVHSSASNEGIVSYIITRLRSDDEIVDSIAPNRLVANWPPAFIEWSTKSVRDAFYSSPQFPRLIKPEAIKESIARGIASGILAYVGKTGSGAYAPFFYNQSIIPADIEISEDRYIIKAEVAEEYKKAQIQPPAPPNDPLTLVPEPIPTKPTNTNNEPNQPATSGVDSPVDTSTPVVANPIRTIKKLSWTGEITWNLWMNFYTKILTKHARGSQLKLTVSIEVTPADGVTPEQTEEMRVALRELGLNDNVREG
jgi:hypothetical protein